MDKETGVEQLQTEWTDGLQQFLQLKHGVKWTPPSLRAFFMSNITYFSKFKGRMYGLTGTLGSQAECELLTSLYSVRFFRLPRSKRRLCIRDEPVVAKTRTDWLDSITRRVNEAVSENRAVLVLCENIETAKSVHGKLHTTHVHSECYVSSLDKRFKKRQRKELAPHDVIVATNLAGRGTDLKLDETLVNNGGLHVIIAFMPANARIEDQAEGRTARGGQWGSYQFVVLSDEPAVDPHESISKLKEKRDIDERERLARLRDRSVPKTELEDHLFQRFFSECCLKSTSSSDSDGKLARKCLMNRWAVWLDENEKLIDDASNAETKVKIIERFERFLIEANAKLTESERLASMPSELISLARTRSDSSATKLYEEVVRNEPGWCENALLELSRLLLASGSSHDGRKNARKHLKRARQLIENRIENLNWCSRVVAGCLKNMKQAIAYEATNRFAEQMRNLVNLWNVHLSSVNKLLGVPLERALPNYIEKDIVYLSTAALPKSSKMKRHRYSKKIVIRKCERSHKEEIFTKTLLGEELIALLPFVAHCRIPLMDAMKKAIGQTNKQIYESEIEKVIKDEEKKFWNTLVQEGYVDENSTEESFSILSKYNNLANLEPLPSELTQFEKVLPDWLKRHECEMLDRDSLNTTGLSDTLHSPLVGWLRTCGLVKTVVEDRHRKLKPIPSVEENPKARIGPYLLVEWSGVFAEWFVGGNETYVKLPDFEERATKLAKHYVHYLINLGIAKPLAVRFPFNMRKQSAIDIELDEIKNSYSKIPEFRQLAKDLYGSGDDSKVAEILRDPFSAFKFGLSNPIKLIQFTTTSVLMTESFKKTLLSSFEDAHTKKLLDNVLAAVRDHIGQLKLFETEQLDFCNLKTIVSRPEDPVFGQRDECDEMASRHCERVVYVADDKVSRWKWMVTDALTRMGVFHAYSATGFSLFSALSSKFLTYAFQLNDHPLTNLVSSLTIVTLLATAIGNKTFVSSTDRNFYNAIASKCTDAIASLAVGRAVYKYLDWLKTFVLEQVLERAKPHIYKAIKPKLDKMKELLAKLVSERVNSGVPIIDAIQRIKRIVADEDPEQKEMWRSGIANAASHLAVGMRDIFNNSCRALTDTYSLIRLNSHASNASTTNTDGIANSSDDGKIVKTVKLCVAFNDYGRKAIRLTKDVENVLLTVKNLYEQASSRIESRNEQLIEQLIKLKSENASTGIETATSAREITSDEETEIERCVGEVAEQMQVETIRLVLDTIQSVWFEPLITESIQNSVDMLTADVLSPLPQLDNRSYDSRLSSDRQINADYEHFAENVGQGVLVGPVEMQNAADALDLNFEISDKVGDYSKDSGNGSCTYYARGNPYSKAKTVKVEFTANVRGSKHMALVKEDGTRCELTPDPNQPANQCLYEALDKFTGATTGNTEKLCKDYAKTNERAQLMHRIGVDGSAYTHLGAGNNKKQLEVKLWTNIPMQFDSRHYRNQRVIGERTLDAKTQVQPAQQFTIQENGDNPQI